MAHTTDGIYASINENSKMKYTPANQCGYYLQLVQWNAVTAVAQSKWITCIQIRFD